MVKFEIVSTGEIKIAYSVEIQNEKAVVKYSEKGKEYRYNKNNIRLLPSSGNSENKLIVYAFERRCWQCGKTTEILTYIKFLDNADEDVTFPWDKHRLLKLQDLFSHMQYPEIEFYGLHIVGDLEKYDKILMDNFSDRLREEYSKTVDDVYTMNICSHCGAKQGKFFVYKAVNEMIKAMQPIKIIKEIDC